MEANTGVAAFFLCLGLTRTSAQKMLKKATLFMYGNYNDIHIGPIIELRIRAAGISYAELARALNVDRTTIYNIVKAKSIDIDRLIRISQILNYDFIRNVYLLSEEEGVEVRIKLTKAERQRLLAGGSLHIKLIQ